MQHLANLPLFAGLEVKARRALAACARRRTFAAGDVLSREGEQADALYALVRGEVAIKREGRFITLIDAPDVVGLIALLDGAPRTATIEAFSDVEVYEISIADFRTLMRQSTVLDENLVQHLANELRRVYRKNESLLRHFDDFFIAPNARLVPGPYYADPFDYFLFAMRDTPDRLQKLLPPGLSPMPGLAGHYLLTFSFFSRFATESPLGAGKTFAYDEVAPFLPCVGPGLKPGLFCPELYPDNCLAMTLGRELYGFPKRFGDIDRGARRIDLVTGGRMTLRADWQSESPQGAAAFMEGLARSCGPDDRIHQLLGRAAGQVFRLVSTERFKGLWPELPIFLHKQIPDAQSGSDVLFEIDELVSVPFQLTHLEDFVQLENPGVRILDPDWFLGGACVGAWRFRLGFRFGKGRELIDYTASPRRWPRLRRRP